MLREDINTALKVAMKAGDARRVSTLRLVNSTLKNADIEARGGGKQPLGDASPDPAAAAGDDGDSVLELHGCPLLARSAPRLALSAGRNLANEARTIESEPDGSIRAGRR